MPKAWKQKFVSTFLERIDFKTWIKCQLETRITQKRYPGAHRASTPYFGITVPNCLQPLIILPLPLDLASKYATETRRIFVATTAKKKQSELRIMRLEQTSIRLSFRDLF